MRWRIYTVASSILHHGGTATGEKRNGKEREGDMRDSNANEGDIHACMQELILPTVFR